MIEMNWFDELCSALAWAFALGAKATAKATQKISVESMQTAGKENLDRDFPGLSFGSGSVFLYSIIQL